MTPEELQKLGIPSGAALDLAIRLCGDAARDGHAKKYIRQRLAEVVADPDEHANDADFGELAQAIVLRSRARSARDRDRA